MKKIGGSKPNKRIIPFDEEDLPKKEDEVQTNQKEENGDGLQDKINLENKDKGANLKLSIDLLKKISKKNDYNIKSAERENKESDDEIHLTDDSDNEVEKIH